MGAPTSVRVEAESISTTRVRWSDNGTAPIGVYRSTDGSAYSLVSDPLVTIGTEEYNDTGLATGTKYWYKLSDDAGATFSSVVTVWTHACPDEGATREGPVPPLPRFDGTEQQAAELNILAERVERALGDVQFPIDQCLACPDDGAVVLDCANGCNHWIIIADEDINSVSINSCGEDPPEVEIVIPPNTTGRKVCGFPRGFGFTGDECTDAPLSSGSSGSTLSVGGSGSPESREGYPSGDDGSGSGGGAGGADCTCVPGAQGELTIKSCNNDNSLDCLGSKELKLIACGGRPPYTWSKTGSVSLSVTSGNVTVVTPPANTGSAVAGVAYTRGGQRAEGPSSCAGVSEKCEIDHGCDDQPEGTARSTPANPTELVCNCNASCSQASQSCGLDSCGTSTSGSCNSITGTYMDGEPAAGVITDTRTAPMIAAGCNPCGLNAGATVTVTDDVGTQTTIVLNQ